MTDLVFVYGTLKRGYGNHYRLARSPFLGEATSVGSEYAMADGIFPKMADYPGGYPVRGEVFEVDKATLQKLDALEGHPHWYRRQMRRFLLERDGSEVEAWVYLMPELTAECYVQPTNGTLSWSSPPLTRDEHDLLNWIVRQWHPRHASCAGPVLDGLVRKGLVEVAPSGTVNLTAAGRVRCT